MKKISKDNGEMILCSDNEDELDDDSLLEEGGKEESFNEDFKNPTYPYSNIEEFSDFGVTQDLNVTIAFGEIEPNNLIVPIDEIHGILKSHSKRYDTNKMANKHKIKFFIDITNSSEQTLKINKLCELNKKLDFKICTSFMGETCELHGTGNILYYKISKIKNGKALYKIILGQRY